MTKDPGDQLLAVAKGLDIFHADKLFVATSVSVLNFVNISCCRELALHPSPYAVSSTGIDPES